MTRSLGETDDGSQLDAHVGETITINLPENATSGYRWAIDHYAQDVVEALGTEPTYKQAGQVTQARVKAGSGVAIRGTLDHCSCGLPQAGTRMARRRAAPGRLAPPTMTHPSWPLRRGLLSHGM